MNLKRPIEPLWGTSGAHLVINAVSVSHHEAMINLMEPMLGINDHRVGLAVSFIFVDVLAVLPLDSGSHVQGVVGVTALARAFGAN